MSDVVVVSSLTLEIKLNAGDAAISANIRGLNSDGMLVKLSLRDKSVNDFLDGKTVVFNIPTQAKLGFPMGDIKYD